MGVKEEIKEIAKGALGAYRTLSLLSGGEKDAILEAFSDAIDLNREEILAENKKDVEDAKGNNLSKALVDRLFLDESRIDSIISAIDEIRNLKDCVGEIINEDVRPNGLKIKKVRVPIGVIGIIYESRPNITAEAASLCLKSSNVSILRGGKESLRTNRAILKCMEEGGKNWGMPKGAINLIQTVDKDAVKYLVESDEFLDLIIPRGGEGLIKAVSSMSKVPVIKHYKGVCHTYIDKDADFKKGREISVNAKCSRPGVCNAMETLLVNREIAKDFLPELIKELEKRGVEIRGDREVLEIVGNKILAEEEDWSSEYLDLILSIKVVDSVYDAINHINKYGSKHSDAIVTENKKTANEFFKGVDSSSVYLNASTRFTDGGEFGLGAEIGISTDKIHARGPMGIKELTTYKYQIEGSGQVRE